PVHHLTQMMLRPFDRLHPFARDRKSPLRAPATFGGRFAELGSDQSLRGQPVQSGVNGADRNVASGAFGNFQADLHSVGIAAETKHGKQDNVLEFAEKNFLRHDFYIVEEIRRSVKRNSQGRGGGRASAREAFSLAP